MIYLVGTDPLFQYVNESSENHPEELRSLLTDLINQAEIELIAEDFDNAQMEELEFSEIVGQTVALDHSIPHRFISPDASDCEEYDIQTNAELLELKAKSNWTDKEFEDALTDNNGRREEFLMDAIRNDLDEDSNILIICPCGNVEGLCDLLEEDSYEYEIIDELTANK